MLVVEELYREAVMSTDRQMIIFNGELDRIRSGCILGLSAVSDIKQTYGQVYFINRGVTLNLIDTISIKASSNKYFSRSYPCDVLLHCVLIAPSEYDKV